MPDRIDGAGFQTSAPLPMVPYADMPHSEASLQRSAYGNVGMSPLKLADRNRLLAYRIFTEDERFDNSDWEHLVDLFQRESSWNHQARNPKSTARGLPQAMGSLNPETMTDEWLNDPAAQIRWGLNYIKNRYGTVANAIAHHNRKGWY